MYFLKEINFNIYAYKFLYFLKEIHEWYVLGLHIFFSLLHHIVVHNPLVVIQLFLLPLQLPTVKPISCNRSIFSGFAQWDNGT